MLEGDVMRKSADEAGLTEEERREKWMRAIDHYDNDLALGEDPRMAQMLYGKGVALKKLRQPAEALVLFEEVSPS